MTPAAAIIAQQVLAWRTESTPLIVGICGPQASGKTTAAAAVAAHLTELGLTIGLLSLDDLYLGQAVRKALAKEVHPLFATRGPPGTHDVALGLSILAQVRAGEDVHLPRFSKRYDAQMPQTDWPFLARCDVMLFEGWCIGARPQDNAALAEPINTLEREEDQDGVWRRAVNAHLSGATRALFQQIDRLIYLRPPSFDVVYQWRCEQEHALIATGDAPAAMTDTLIKRFVSHYERLTRNMMADMPSYADLVIQLDAQREVKSPGSGVTPQRARQD